MAEDVAKKLGSFPENTLYDKWLTLESDFRNNKDGYETFDFYKRVNDPMQLTPDSSEQRPDGWKWLSISYIWATHSHGSADGSIGATHAKDRNVGVSNFSTRT